VKPCGVPLPAGLSTLLCPREKHRPAGFRGSIYCYWHRLARTAMEFQAAQAEVRRGPSGDTPSRARIPETDWPADERWCAGCQSFVPLWYCTGSRCKACSWVTRRDQRNQATYGLGREAFDALLLLQEGKCAICGKRQLDRAIAVDHDHKTAAVRGLLCKSCNHGILGSAHDSVRMLRAAVYYLERPPASGTGWSVEERNAMCDKPLS
jgi:hypothetical protein